MKKIKIDKSKFIANSVTTVLSFMLFIVLVLFTLVFGVYVGFLRKSVIITNLYTTSYGEDVQEVIYSESEDVALSSSVPIEAVENAFPLDMVKHDINKYAEYSMEGKTYTVDTTDIEETINKNIDNYLEAEGLTITQENQENIDEFISAITSIYKSKIKVPFIGKFTIFKDKFMEIFYIAIIVTILLAAASVYMIIKIQKWPHRAVRYVIYSVISTTVLTLGVPIIILASGVHKRINFATSYLYKLVVAVIEDFMMTYVYLGMFWIIITVVLFMLVTRLKKICRR